MPTSSLEESVIAKLRELPAEKQQEVLDFADFLVARKTRPLKSLEGLWVGQGVDVSDEDIAELRREVWASFPRDPD